MFSMPTIEEGKIDFLLDIEEVGIDSLLDIEEVGIDNLERRGRSEFSSWQRRVQNRSP